LSRRPHRADLRQAEHETSELKLATKVLFDAMTETCEL